MVGKNIQDHRGDNRSIGKHIFANTKIFNNFRDEMIGRLMKPQKIE